MQFINTTLPYLDDANNASVRSYTTRANFARRRRDRARLLFRARTAGSQPGTGRRNELALAPLLARNAHPLTVTLSHQEFFLLDYLFRISYPFAFASTQNEPARVVLDSLAQQSWLDLVFAAPAMTQATMCLAATHYHQRGGGAEYLALAYRYNGRAIQAINNTLNDPIARFSDGLVTAVFTLAFSAHLVEDESTWGTHILGAAHIASARLAATQRLLPTWLSDLLFGSFLNYIFRKAHRIEFRNVAGTTGLPFFDSFPLEVQFCFADRVFWVNASSLPASRALRSTSFHKALENLLCQQSPVSETPRPSIRALNASLEIFTRLFWPKSSHDHDHGHEHEHLGNASSELRQVFQGPNIRLCATVELTLWEFILGYIAAGDLEAKRWFARMLVRACRAMQTTSWDRAVTVFSAFLYTESFLHACHAVWHEAILPELHPKTFRQSFVAVTVPAQNEEQEYGHSHAM